MPYKATGKPPGRPRKDGLPAGTKPEDKKPSEPERHEVPARPGNEVPMELARICTECYPDGWPEGWTGTACPHGVWARRA